MQAIPPKAGVRIVVRSLAELDDDVPYLDPEGIAPVTLEKVAAFRENPLRGGDGDPAQLLAVTGDRVVGRVDVFRGEVTVFGKTAPLLWGSALSVPPAFRTTGAGAMLVLRLSSLGAPVAGFGFSQAAIPIYRSLRWTAFELPRWVLVRRSRAVLEQRFGAMPARLRRPTAVAAAAIVDPLLAGALVTHRLGRAGRGDLTAREVSLLPPELDARIASPGRPIFTHRSSRHLAWLTHASFGRGRHDPVRRLFLVQAPDGTVVAYFLVKTQFYESASQEGYRNLELGSLQDWFVLDERAASFESILLLAIDVLSDEGVDAIEVCETGPEVAQAVRRLGLRRAGATHFMFRAPRGNALAAPEAAQRSSWRLTPAEGDSSFG